MNEINKDELLDLTKWHRFFFMVIYSFAINGVVGILIIIAAVQFFFYLFTSKINNQLQTANNWLHGFFSDSLNFLSFFNRSSPNTCVSFSIWFGTVESNTVPTALSSR